MPSDVSGLTKHDAASAAVVPSFSSSASAAFAVRNCAYIAPPNVATVLPSKACASFDEPAFTTTPAPSLPTGRAWSNRAAIIRIAGAGICAVTLRVSPDPLVVALLMSAGPISSPRSDGLIGVASTRITISSAAGSATGTRASEISSTPSFVKSDRSCRPEAGTFVMSILLDFPAHPPRLNPLRQ